MNSGKLPLDSKSAEQQVSEPAVSVEERSPRRGRGKGLRRPTMMGLLILVLAAAAYPAYRYWHGHRTGQYKAACVEAVAEASWEQLDAIAARWVDWDPSSSDAWIYLGEASLQLGDLERAAECLGNVDDSYHGALQALAIRGDLLFSDLNRVHDAVETWQRMLRIDPHADLARQRLIYFYAMTFQRQAMLEHIRIAMQLRCEPPEAYSYYLLAYEVNFSDGLSLITKWREHHPDDELLEVARAIYVAKYSPRKSLPGFSTLSIAPGDHSLINECLAKYPQNIEVLAFHLDNAIFEGDSAQVLELLSRCPPEAEQDARFWRYRGWFLAGEERHEEAEHALLKALELHPVEWRSRWTLAGVLRRLGRLAEATEASRVASLGKDLRQELFELPNARALDHDLFTRIHAYLGETGPPLVWEALSYRIETDSDFRLPTAAAGFGAPDVTR